MREKRRFLRIPFEEEVQFIYSQKHYTGKLRDLGLGGFFIEAPEFFPPLQAELDLLLHLIGTSPPLKITMHGKVVRVEPERGFGFKITSIPPSSFQHLKNFILYNLPSCEEADLEIKKFLSDFETPHQWIKALNIFHLKDEITPYLLERAFQYSPDKPFVLASGKESPYYLDCRRITLYAPSYKLIGELFWEELRYTDIEGVAGMSMGADPLVCSILYAALEEGRVLEGILIRKEPKKYGTQKQLEGNFWEGMKVAVVEDVVTTGGSLLKAIKACEKEALQIREVLALVDREEGGKELIKEHGYELKSFFTLSEILNLYHQRAQG